VLVWALGSSIPSKASAKRLVSALTAWQSHHSGPIQSTIIRASALQRQLRLGFNWHFSFESPVRYRLDLNRKNQSRYPPME
jgi:hypothetical protein